MAELLLERKGRMRTPARGVTCVHHVQMCMCRRVCAHRVLQGRTGQSESSELMRGDSLLIHQTRRSPGAYLSSAHSWLVS